MQKQKNLKTDEVATEGEIIAEQVNKKNNNTTEEIAKTGCALAGGITAGVLIAIGLITIIILLICFCLCFTPYLFTSFY